MPEVVTCPQCERQLRVPDELIGQRVKCPTCGTNFTANVETLPRSGGEEEPRSGAGPLEPRPPESGEDLPRRLPRSDAGLGKDYGDRGYDDYSRPEGGRSRRALGSL